MANVATTSHPESFVAAAPGFEGAPRTSTSLSSSSGGPPSHTPSYTSGGPESSTFLRPHAQKAAALAARRATASLSPKSDKATHPPAHLSPRSTPLPFTGAAAIAEMKRQKQGQAHPLMNSRQTSPNPQVQAMQSLLGAGGMSKPTDAPAPDKMSEPLRKAAEKISVPDSNARADTEQDVSPASLGSFGSTLEGSGMGGANSAMTATANEHNPHQQPQFVAEPTQMDDQHFHNRNNGHLAVQHQEDDRNLSLSYPGPAPHSGQGQEGGPSRSMTLSGSGYGQGSPKSPAATGKRHKCPYCSTDFTRHHNLKSHLLTHSQEKPYVCQTCQARFRRLHDLKRHTKLHTGERPHTCDKCGRKFARGDALARHNKGPGGCAGRRSSLGGDDDFDDNGGDGMDGVEYETGEEAMDDQGRRINEPNRKRQQLETPQDADRQVYRQHSSTYPPAPRQMQGSMGPPQVVPPGPGSATSPRDTTDPSNPAGGGMNSAYYGQGQVFAEPGMMTHSPKPLSPGHQQSQQRLSVDNSAQLGRDRSTSLTTQFQQAHFGRGSVGGTGNRSSPQPITQFGGNQQAPHNILPPIGSTSQPQHRGGLQPSVGGPNSNNNMMGSHPAQYATAPSNAGSLSSQGRSSGSSIRDIAGQDSNDIWQYVRQLEQKFGRMQDEYELRISRLQEEVIALRGQVGQISNAGSYSSDMIRQGPYA